MDMGKDDHVTYLHEAINEHSDDEGAPARTLSPTNQVFLPSPRSFAAMVVEADVGVVYGGARRFL